ncbi:FAD-binding oxidoreductase [Gordonia sp. VNK21]|uniref:FAD-binding oxidoreductase n=1 Tax=Gordonia sp. VNK21 TaxID=3382483 RepID=UPI0038D4B18A
MTVPQDSVLHRLRTLVGADPDRFARSVFSRFLGLTPAARELFPADMSRVRPAFVEVTDHVLAELPEGGDHFELIELLAQLGRDNRKYGAREEHYELLGQALTDEFAALLGDGWTPDAAQTVSQAVLLATGVMRGAAQSATGPATWRARVVQKFVINRERAVVRLAALDPVPEIYPGQYLETRIPQWPFQWRDFSPATPVDDRGELEFHIRAVPGGQVSGTVVRETAVGDVWSFAQPHGTLAVDGDRPVLMVAGGTGLAPLRALLLSMAQRTDNPSVHLFYGARFPAELYELATLAQLATGNPWLTVTGTVDEQRDPWWIDTAPDPHQWGVPVVGGRVDEVVTAAGDWTGRQVLIAGPSAMISSTVRALRAVGVPADAIAHDPVH